MAKAKDPVDILDVDNLTLEQIGTAIDKTLDRLHILQNLYAAVAAREHRRVEKLVKEYREALAAVKEEEANTGGDQQHGSSSPDVPALP